MNAISLTKPKIEEEKVLVFKSEATIQYHAAIEDICALCVSPGVKYISDDVLKTKLNIKKGGSGHFDLLRRVELALFDFGNRKSHEEAKSAMKESGFEDAGLHEILHFTNFVAELPELEKDFSITALRDEMIDKSVEFVPTIYGLRKKHMRILMCFRADLPFKHSYFLGVRYL
jgi:hypothetical protein